MVAHMLLIDDDLAVLEMMREVLEEEGGYRVTIASVLFEDLAEVKRLQPDLILLDIIFGGRQLGWEFLQRLKLYRATMRIPIILCTAGLHDVREQETMLLQKGIPILYKPFDIDELLLLVRQQLNE